MKVHLDLNGVRRGDPKALEQAIDVQRIAIRIENGLMQGCALLRDGILVLTEGEASREDVSRTIGRYWDGDPFEFPGWEGILPGLLSELATSVEKLYRMYGSGQEALSVRLELSVVARKSTWGELLAELPELPEDGPAWPPECVMGDGMVQHILVSIEHSMHVPCGSIRGG